MATLESTTSPSVKQMLVDTQGTDQWVGAGKAQGGMASGRSQLGADIHEIDNAASRCGRLLDEVAGDAEAVAARRDEIIAAMANTAKPYFGDVGEMTYLQWLQRYVELAIGDGDSTADTAAPGSPWLADTWRDRFEQMLQRAEARLHPQGLRPDRDAVRRRPALLEKPDEAIAALRRPLPGRRDRAAAPGRCAVLRHAVQDAGQAGQLRAGHRQGRTPLVAQRFAVAGARRPLRRRPGLHHPRHRGGRRHHPARRARRRAARPLRAGRDRRGAARPARRPTPVTARRQGRTDVRGPLATVLDAPDVLWAGRTATNPVHRIAEPGRVAGARRTRQSHEPHTRPPVRAWRPTATRSC